MSDVWKLDGLCATGTDDTMFVKGAAQNTAAQLCRDCPVIRTCLAYALDRREEYGVWGGQTERQRRALLKRRPDISSWARVLGAVDRVA